MSASRLFDQMVQAVNTHAYERQSTDPHSPQQQLTFEAEPTQRFVLPPCFDNVIEQRPVNTPWATANILHFFADTEDAAPLKKYNKYAERFAPNGKWVGAYGRIAMRQLRDCVLTLTRSPQSRRAFVSMGEAQPVDLNRPCCWSYLGFLIQDGVLHMSVHQRSLNLFGVMAYDCTLLTNIHAWMAYMLECSSGPLTWVVDSLHYVQGDMATRQPPQPGLWLPLDVLSEPEVCWDWLIHPEKTPEPWRTLLCGSCS